MKMLKKLFAVLLCAVTMMSFTVTAGAVSSQDGFLYERIDNSNVMEIVGIDPDGELADAQTLVIPYTIRGLSVIQIGASAFIDNKSVQNITLTSSIRQIGDNAMYGMKALKKITLPQNLTVLGEKAFAYCSSLETVSFNTKNLLQINEFTFYGCTRLNNVILPDNLFEIGEYAFSQCMSLDKIYIPSSVSVIADNAFYSTRNGFTIYGEWGTPAHIFALNNHIPFVDLKGKYTAALSDRISEVAYRLKYEDSSLYTEETFNALSEAYENAVAVKENFFSVQSEVDTALAELDNAYNALRLKSMDTLDTLITQAENEMAVSFRYTESSVNTLEEAINQAKTVQNEALPSESQVQNAVSSLNNSINALTEVIRYDINLDGNITLADIVLVQRMLISDNTFSQRDVYLADFNNDNQITLADIIAFQRYLLTR